MFDKSSKRQLYNDKLIKEEDISLIKSTQKEFINNKSIRQSETNIPFLISKKPDFETEKMRSILMKKQDKLNGKEEENNEKPWNDTSKSDALIEEIKDKIFRKFLIDFCKNSQLLISKGREKEKESQNRLLSKSEVLGSNDYMNEGKEKVVLYRIKKSNKI